MEATFSEYYCPGCTTWVHMTRITPNDIHLRFEHQPECTVNEIWTSHPDTTEEV